MNQEYYHDHGSSRPSSPSSSAPSTRGGGRPHFMTVGSGASTSASAAALMASLDNDSGYGGSSQGWSPGLTHDLPTPSHTPTLPGQSNAASEHERQVLASHVHQLFYNQNRVALGRAISRIIDMLRDLKEFNDKWPAHYPPIQSAQEPLPTRSDPRPGVHHTQSTHSKSPHHQFSAALRPGPRRAGTSLGEDTTAESSNAAARRTVPEPERLITPEAAHDFSILKLDLQVNGLSASEISRHLRGPALAELLHGKISSSIRHLQLLRDRIEDTSSKVLVTGDLNAGKSTFCNALLRRKLLPVDQLPCTSIFTEVLDARENGSIEEVHAVHKDSVYNRDDESTYDVYTLLQLEKVVTDSVQYTQCKVYVRDIRSVDESLLNNGVVDISIIDAPGLSTTNVFLSLRPELTVDQISIR